MDKMLFPGNEDQDPNIQFLEDHILRTSIPSECEHAMPNPPNPSRFAPYQRASSSVVRPVRPVAMYSTGNNFGNSNSVPGYNSGYPNSVLSTSSSQGAISSAPSSTDGSSIATSSESADFKDFESKVKSSSFIEITAEKLHDGGRQMYVFIKFLDKSEKELCKIQIPRNFVNLSRSGKCSYFFSDGKQNPINLESFLDKEPKVQALRPLLMFPEKDPASCRYYPHSDGNGLSWNLNPLSVCDEFCRQSLIRGRPVFVFPDYFQSIRLEDLLRCAQPDSKLIMEMSDPKYPEYPADFKGRYIKRRYEFKVDNQRFEIFWFQFPDKVGINNFVYRSDAKQPNMFYKIDMFEIKSLKYELSKFKEIVYHRPW
eukprot:GHVP01064416.1.p1 GENE.GHVP01064416.1~~GHVP01064416.1.p1  ORF type:complete len:369 (-),score=49.05 GHVP01064416.1:1374-2480(-)